MTTGRINQVAAFRERRPEQETNPVSVVTPSLARKGWSEERAKYVFSCADRQGKPATPRAFPPKEKGTRVGLSRGRLRTGRLLRIRSENRLPPNAGEAEDTERLISVERPKPSPPAGGGASPADPRDRVDRVFSGRKKRGSQARGRTWLMAWVLSLRIA